MHEGDEVAQVCTEVSGPIGGAPVPPGLPHQVPDEDRERQHDREPRQLGFERERGVA